MKKITIDLILIGVIVVFTLSLWIVYKEFKSEGSLCMLDPLVYGAKQYSEGSGSDLTCSCSFSSQEYLPFIVNKNQTKPLKAFGNQIITNITKVNLTKVNITLWKGN